MPVPGLCYSVGFFFDFRELVVTDFFGDGFPELANFFAFLGAFLSFASELHSAAAAATRLLCVDTAMTELVAVPVRVISRVDLVCAFLQDLLDPVTREFRADRNHEPGDASDERCGRRSPPEAVGVQAILATGYHCPGIKAATCR